MPRIAPVDPATASDDAKPLLDAVQAALGTTPNMMKTMAQAPRVLEGYLALSGALSKGTLGGRLGELLAIDVAEANKCNYCLSAHAYLGENVAKLSTEQIDAARRGESPDARHAAALGFAKALNEQRGAVSDAQVEAVRAAGWSDAAILEIVAHVALNVLTNYLNVVAGTEIDFPVLETAAA